jgi:hypothetical protein
MDTPPTDWRSEASPWNMCMMIWSRPSLSRPSNLH